LDFEIYGCFRLRRPYVDNSFRFSCRLNSHLGILEFKLLERWELAQKRKEQNLGCIIFLDNYFRDNF